MHSSGKTAALGKKPVLWGIIDKAAVLIAFVGAVGLSCTAQRAVLFLRYGFFASSTSRRSNPTVFPSVIIMTTKGASPSRKPAPSPLSRSIRARSRPDHANVGWPGSRSIAWRFCTTVSKSSVKENASWLSKLYVTAATRTAWGVIWCSLINSTKSLVNPLITSV